MTGLKDFSTDAPSNDVAAPPINWQEGMPANAVNNSACATMAALKAWHDDQVGGIAATGAASNALSAASNQIHKADDLGKAFTVAFQADNANTGPVTLNLDGIGARPLRRTGNIDLAPGDLGPGQPIRVTWLANLACYTILSPAIERPGRVAAFASEGAVPPGWVVCDGRALSRTAYAPLLAFIGLGYGAPDANTFRVPDFRGRTLFGADSGANRLTGAGGLIGGLTAVGGSETVTLSADQMPSHSHGGSTAGAGGHDHGGSTGQAGAHDHGGTTGQAGAHNHGGSTATAGGHQHTGTTNTGGSHGHAVRYAVGTAGSGSANRVVNDIAPNGGVNAGGASELSGDHNHDFTTAAGGDHSHGVTITGVSDHGHGISGAPAHGHGIAAVADHTHGLTLDNAGGGGAHPNIPPGAIVIWAVKA